MHACVFTLTMVKQMWLKNYPIWFFWRRYIISLRNDGVLYFLSLGKKKLKDKNQIKKSHCLGLVLWLIFEKKISWCLSYLFPEIDVILSLSFSFFLNFNFLLFFIFSLCVIELFCLTWGSWFILPSKKLLIS